MASKNSKVAAEVAAITGTKKPIIDARAKNQELLRNDYKSGTGMTLVGSLFTAVGQQFREIQRMNSVKHRGMGGPRWLRAV